MVAVVARSAVAELVWRDSNGKYGLHAGGLQHGCIISVREGAKREHQRRRGGWHGPALLKPGVLRDDERLVESARLGRLPLSLRSHDKAPWRGVEDASVRLRTGEVAEAHTQKCGTVHVGVILQPRGKDGKRKRR